jgi:hypothetical protein
MREPSRSSPWRKAMRREPFLFLLGRGPFVARQSSRRRLAFLRCAPRRKFGSAGEPMRYDQLPEAYPEGAVRLLCIPLLDVTVRGAAIGCLQEVFSVLPAGEWGVETAG